MARTGGAIVIGRRCHHKAKPHRTKQLAELAGTCGVPANGMVSRSMWNSQPAHTSTPIRTASTEEAPAMAVVTRRGSCVGSISAFGIDLPEPFLGVAKRSQQLGFEVFRHGASVAVHDHVASARMAERRFV